jgi:L-alanine-DL-glutamate epimerase-like enolase superfamily enzyme
MLTAVELVDAARHARVRVVTRELPVRLRSSIRNSVHVVVVELEDDGGLGTGYCFTFQDREASALLILIEEMLEVIRDRDWRQVRSIWNELWFSINYAGQSGPPVMALAAVDTALWDLLGQHADMPLYKMWGAATSSVPAYVSGGWLSYSVDELAQDALNMVADGFTRYKMKIGGPNQEVDIARVSRVLEAVGHDIEVMVDANEAYTRDEALKMGKRLQELGITWFEEPLDASDVDGAAMLTAALELRIAMGETVYGIREFRRLMVAGAADVLRPDLMRCGGITPLRDLQILASARRLETSPHLFPEINAHVAASSPGQTLIEYVPTWLAGIFVGSTTVRGGDIVLGDAPGIGFRVNPDLLHSK